jgi:hypothetical protein
MKEKPIQGGREEIQTSTSVISLGSDRILRVIFKTNAVITPKTLKADHKIYTRLANGGKHPFLFDAGHNAVYTSEARDFAHKLSSESMTAVAVIVRNLAHRLIAEFYYRINKPTVPYKVFGSIEDAVDWLKLYL